MGKLLVHEVGYWFEDTPAEFKPNLECVVGRDTCPEQEGLDPITSFMGLSL